jgi:hypothetical protein
MQIETELAKIDTMKLDNLNATDRVNSRVSR